MEDCQEKAGMQNEIRRVVKALPGLVWSALSDSQIDFLNHRVRLSVQDAGVGFEPQDVSRLFEAFYTSKSGGMGIGLSVSRSIIESHHGRLWATSNDGLGATFSFSIPRASHDVKDAARIGAIRTSASMDAERAVRKI